MKKILFGLIVSLFATSCYEEPVVWDSSVVELAGDWTVVIYDADMNPYYGSHILTYNTADDNGDMWVDLHDDFDVVERTIANTSDLTFESKDNDDFSVSGQVFKEVVERPETDNLADSIYIEVMDAGTKYIVAGYKTTGFE